MKLEGSLDAFGLPDVVTLLATTGKTGGLLLRRTGDDRTMTEGAVWFRDGRVCGATSDRSRASLVRRVVGSGAVDDNALRQAVSRAVSAGGGVARALLESGSVDPDLLRQAADDQTVDAVFDLLRWSAGDFAFDPGASDPDDIGLAVEHGRVLAEARARVEAWASLIVVIPSVDSVLTVPTVLGHDPEVSRDEWALLSLVDGHRRVGDLVELTGAGEFAVTTILARLAQRGLLHVKDAAAPDHVAIVERRLGMLASIEGSSPAVPEAPQQQQPVAVEEPVAGPGAQGMSAAAALAAARAAQGLPQSGNPGSGAKRTPRHEVVPPRPEPFLPGRRPEHPEPAPERVAGASAHRATPAYSAPASPVGVPFPGSIGSRAGSVEGATARSLADPDQLPAPDPRHDSTIERDPAMNRSLLLRLIAGVRGL
ncbi:DUF4388 domain-containing protein [Longivirga aurantiaca]|uniref:DUF4388 domain-containing protein n=1 Tax=Longivirga aurantiaca TaxID=1837743 RepID=A0ABW1T242_9ACTN